MSWWEATQLVSIVCSAVFFLLVVLVSPVVFVIWLSGETVRAEDETR